MAYPLENINRSTVLDAEIEGHISDAANSSLSASAAAAAILHRIAGATFNQVLAAGIYLLREERMRPDDEISDLEDEIGDLEDEVEDLRAQLAGQKRPTP
jgi:hypothetical protein